MVIEFLGIRMYTLGLYTAFGALCAAAVIGVLGSSLGLKRGSALLAVLLPAVCGLVCSRLAFCAVYRFSGKALPLSLWAEASGGGWSLAGLLAGWALGGWFAARAAGEGTGTILDILCLAVLPLIAAERMGEARIPAGNDATVHTIAAAAALALFMVLLALLVRKRETDGTLSAVFLVLAGAGTTVLEGLREKAFLPVFGGTSLLQAAGIAMIAAGIPAVIHQVRKKKNEPLPDDHSYRKGKRAP